MSHQNPEHAVIEQTIAVAVMQRHNRLLENGCVDGVNVGLKFIDEVRGGSFYRRNLNGKVQVRVGKEAHWVTGEPSVGFKQKKDGTHSYDKIADKLVEMADYSAGVQRRKDAERNKYTENNAFIHELEEDLNLSAYSSKLSANINTGSLTFKVNSLTQEQAEAFVLLGMTLGVIKEKPKS